MKAHKIVATLAIAITLLSNPVSADGIRDVCDGIGSSIRGVKNIAWGTVTLVPEAAQFYYNNPGAALAAGAHFCYRVGARNVPALLDNARGINGVAHRNTAYRTLAQEGALMIGEAWVFMGPNPASHATRTIDQGFYEVRKGVGSLLRGVVQLPFDYPKLTAITVGLTGATYLFYPAQTLGALWWAKEHVVGMLPAGITHYFGRSQAQGAGETNPYNEDGKFVLPKDFHQ